MNKYSELLKNQIWASVVAIALILALSLILFMLNKKHFFNDMGKIGKIAVNIFVIAVILLKYGGIKKYTALITVMK